MSEMSKMNKVELIRKIAAQTGLTHNEIKAVLAAYADILTASAKRSGSTVALPGVGKIVTVRRAARASRNPRTGEKAIVPERNSLMIKASKWIRAAMQDAVE